MWQPTRDPAPHSHPSHLPTIHVAFVAVQFVLQGYLHDTASPYAHRVHFTVYTIKDTSRNLGPWRDRGDQGGGAQVVEGLRFTLLCCLCAYVSPRADMLQSCWASTHYPVPLLTLMSSLCSLFLYDPQTNNTLFITGIDFDLESFKIQLQRLAMPHQTFSFSQVGMCVCLL